VEKKFRLFQVRPVGDQVIDDVDLFLVYRYRQAESSHRAIGTGGKIPDWNYTQFGFLGRCHSFSLLAIYGLVETHQDIV
jgi:hypothetical protein